ncbi:hypothetical protein AB0B01_04635 [Streptomyces sp. NPDC044571]|uniref:hypothetical protein n=1 Tax=Streptomyces sp. NPDC044571 TaxID=3155371 RepID=UPI0033E9A6E4
MDGIPAIPHQRNHPETARRRRAAAPSTPPGPHPAPAAQQRNQDGYTDREQ